MKKLTKTMILLLCIMASTFIVFAQTDINYTQVGEDIEIMAKVIDKTIQKEFPDESRIGSSFFSRGFSGCQGFYLKGYGAIFMTGIGFPVAEKKTAQGEERADDLWQQTKMELAGTGGRGYDSNIGEYNSEKVEKLKKELLKAIGAYGFNIRQLSSQENIVVAINGTSLFSPFIYTTGVNLAVPNVSLDALQNALAIPAPEAPPAIPATPVIPKEHSTGVKEPELREPEVKEPELREPEIKQKEMIEKGEEIRKKAADMKHVEIELKEVQKEIAGAQKDYEKAIKQYKFQAMPAATGRSRTTLIIRASKNDIMAYKNNKIGFDEFLKQTEIIQY